MERDPSNNPSDVIIVAFPDDADVVRVEVEAGDTVVLPFDSDAALQMKTGSGNLGIRDDRDHDHTVVLQGFDAAVNDPKNPVVVETSDGMPIDVALVLAMTDPNLDVHGCGGDIGPPILGGGGIYQPFEGAVALSGLEAVGRQDDATGSLGLGSSQQLDVVQ
jgi:hypothetical protein